MPIEIGLLNVDMNFINKPEVVGNQLINNDFISTTDIKTMLHRNLKPEAIVKKMKLKHKHRGVITSSTEQILPYYKKLIDKKVLIPKRFSFVNVSSHCNIYSYGGSAEYMGKDEIHDYNHHNAFVYLFKKGYIDKITWVVPDHYTENQIDGHFKAMDFYKKNAYHIISINQGLRIIVQVIKWSQFLTSKYEWKAITLIANPHTAKYTSEDLQELKKLIS